MNIPLVLQILGNLILLLAGILLIPLGVSLSYGTREEIWAFAFSIIISGVVGLALKFSIKPGKEDITIREGFAVVAFWWMSCAFLAPCLTGYQAHAVHFAILILSR